MSQTLQNVAWLDGIALLLVVGLAIAGAFKGAIRFVVGLAAVAAGVILAGRYGGSLGAEGWPVIADFDDPEKVGTLVGCVILFAGALLVGALVSRMLRKAAEEQDLGGVDRLLGFLFGGLRGALLAAILAVLIMATDFEALRSDAEGSITLRATRKAVAVTRDW